MQNFKIKRAPWKENEVNSMKSRKEKKRAQYIHKFFPMLASSSQKEKDKVHEKYLQVYCKLL